MVKEFIVPLEKQISSEQEEKEVVEKETQETVGQQKRRACGTGTGMFSSASKEQMVAAGGTRRSKRVKVAPTFYVPAVAEESLEASPLASSSVVTRNTALTAAPPLDESSATADGEITPMNCSNEDVDQDSSRRVSAVAAATKGQQKEQSLQDVW